MSFSLVYIGQRCALRIWLFFYDWYVGGARVIGGAYMRTLESLDRTWALRITLRNLLKPLYQDRSLIGVALGFIFRCARIIGAASIYGLLGLITLLMYVCWAAIPISIIVRGFF